MSTKNEIKINPCDNCKSRNKWNFCTFYLRHTETRGDSPTCSQQRKIKE